MNEKTPQKKRKEFVQRCCCYFITQVKLSISQHSLPRRVHARNDAS